jgi:uncharacterized membrane protein YsdA (DUF1294 family)
MAGTVDKKTEVHQIGCKYANDHAVGDDLGSLEKELANSYYWSGSCWTDYRFFVCNWHPLLGMFFSHPMHPWSKLERLAMFACSACLSLVPIALQIQGGTKGELRNTGNAAAALKLFLLVSLPLMLWELVAYRMSIMDIYCMGKHECIAKCARIIKNCVLVLSLIGGVFCAVVAIVYIMPKADEPMPKLFMGLIVSRVQMWIVWFPLYLLIPFLGFVPVWCQEKSRVDEVKISMEDVEAQTCPDGVAEVASTPQKTLCTICGKTREEHPSGKWCARRDDERVEDKTIILPTLLSADVAKHVHAKTLCEVCGKTRDEHANKKWCKRQDVAAMTSPTLCEICGKTRLEHMDQQFCRR